jgi:hypothetical protein
MILTTLMLAGAGCSGINTGGSVSPATFLLPGLLKADPPKSNPSVFPVEAPKQLALA